MRKAGHIRKCVESSKLDFTIVEKAQVRPQPMIMQPDTTVLEIVAFLSYSVFDELHYLRNHEETLNLLVVPQSNVW